MARTHILQDKNGEQITVIATGRRSFDVLTPPDEIWGFSGLEEGAVNNDHDSDEWTCNKTSTSISVGAISLDTSTFSGGTLEEIRAALKRVQISCLGDGSDL